MGFVDAATAAGVRATKEIAAAGTVERKAVAQSDVVLAQDLQAAWGAYAAAERSAVTLNARERATIGSDYKKEVAGAELAAVKAVAPGRKDSMVAAAEANGDYHVRVTRIVADLGILGGEIKLEATKAKASSVTSWLGSAAQGLWDAATSVVSVLSVMYDVISLGAHAGLSVGGMVPLVGGLFDLADLALTAVELPFGKSDRSDLALATLSIATTAVPGPVDAAAGGGKIWVRVGKIGGKIADGIGAAGKGLDEIADAGRNLVASSGILARGTRAREVLAASLGKHSFPVDAQAHHIFGVELFDTQIGQKLRRWGIDLNGSSNGVYLPKYDYPGRTASLHRGRTAKAYNDDVLERLGAARSRAQALDVLSEIREDLLSGRMKINGAE